MKIGTAGVIFGIVTSVIMAGAAVVGTIDQVKNGDRRAEIAGEHAGAMYYMLQNQPKEEKSEEKNKKKFIPS